MNQVISYISLTKSEQNKHFSMVLDKIALLCVTRLSTYFVHLLNISYESLSRFCSQWATVKTSLKDMGL